jgi:Calcineurin-like phosphoesterase/Bacterial Ig domain
MLSSAAILLLPILITPGTVSAEIADLLATRNGLSQEITNCVTSGPSSGGYTVDVCLVHNGNNVTVTGSLLITGTLDVIGSPSLVQIVRFYLDDQYLLTDFEAPYTFELPTDHFIDGTHRLSVDASMRDGFVSNQAAITLNFNNGNATPPVNTNIFTPSSGRPPGPGEPFIVAVVGDGAGGQSTSEPVVDLIASWNPNLFLYLGDVYQSGTFTEFVNWYGNETRLFGQFRNITNPIVGDHEYEGREAPGYYFYWDNIPDFYSFDVAGWHFISLNSTTQFRQREPGSPQYEWLVQDLRDNMAQCTIAFLHQPIFSIGLHGGDERLKDIWAILAQEGVEAVLSGDDHDYQRWHALDDNGRLDPEGATQFVVGTGGQGIRYFSGTDARLARGYDASSETPVFGALNLKLNSRGLEYRFVNVAGDILDFGVIGCESAESDTTPPPPPFDLTSEISSAGHVILNWAEVNDDTGVAGYIIYRDGVELVSLDGRRSSYTDNSTQMDATYTYTLKAFDPTNNMSALSEAVTATTLPAVTLILTPVADAFVDMSTPDTNYGNSSKLRTDTTPTVQSYLRFDVPGLSGNVLSATLRVYANSPSSIGHDVYEVSQSDWDESGITYNTSPQLGHLIDLSEPFESDTWVNVDVTSLITGEGPLSLALLTTSITNISYSSKEGPYPPELIIELGNDSS